MQAANEEEAAERARDHGDFVILQHETGASSRVAVDPQPTSASDASPALHKYRVSYWSESVDVYTIMATDEEEAIERARDHGEFVLENRDGDRVEVDLDE